MKLRFSVFTVLVLIALLPVVRASADTIGIGTAGPFAVLGKGGVTNTGPTVISGSVSGSLVTTAVTGFPPGLVVAGTGTLYPAGPGSSSPFDDATTAYNDAFALSTTGVLTGLDLGGMTLDPGVYFFASSAELTGTLLLDAQGSDTASWTFKIGSTLTTASASTVEVIDAGSAGPFGGSITWAVGSAATLGTTTTFLGTIISDAATGLNTGATIGCGRAISLTAAVTLDTNIIDSPATCEVTVPAGGGGPGSGTIGAPASLVPEPGTWALLGAGLLAMAMLKSAKSRA